ncbi:MAG: hypothetical protein NZ850_00780 [Caldimicrobium sp.]|nr:hypothetical protein [Caldimicrobium sp.]
MEPHSTQRRARACKDCHQDPKVLGLGFGKITLREGRLLFEPLEAPFGETKIRLSQIVDPQGNTLVKFNRPNMRGFNRGELERVLKVGLCLNCHPPEHKIFLEWKGDFLCPQYPFLRSLFFSR